MAEASPAGERSGRGAVPGPAQDGETSTVDHSREWPYRDTASRQDPAESRLDPIWGADPPDSVRWHMGMTTDEEPATAKRQGPLSQPNQGGTREPEGSTAPAAAGATERAAPAREQRAAGGGTTAPASHSPRDADAEVGWFSTEAHPGSEDPDAGHYSGTLSEQLSAERPGDEPAHGTVAGMGPPSRAPDHAGVGGVEPGGRRPVAPESSTLPSGSGPSGSVGAGESPAPGKPAAAQASSGPERPAGGWEPVEAAGSPGTAGPTARGGTPGVETSTGAGEVPGSVGPEAWIGREGEGLVTGVAPGRQEPRSPELIESGMVYVDPDPEIGTPPGAAGWAERSPTGARVHEGSSGDAEKATTVGEATGSAEIRGVAAGGAEAPGAETIVAETLGAEISRSQVGGAGTGGAGAGVGGAGAGGTGTGGSETGGVGTGDAEVSGPESSGAGALGAGAEKGAVASGGASHDGGAEDAVGTADAGGETGGVAGIGDIASAGLAGDMGDAEPRDLVEAGDRHESDSEARPTDLPGTSFISTVDRTPWTEPALPMGLPPGMASPGPGGTSASQDDPTDGDLVPQPDPSWPRLFGPGLGSEGTGEPGRASDARLPTTHAPQGISSEQSRDAAEYGNLQGDEIVPEPGEGGFQSSAEGGVTIAGERAGSTADEPERPAAGEPVQPEGEDSAELAQVHVFRATSGVGLGGSHQLGRSTERAGDAPRGAPELADDVPADTEGTAASGTPESADPPPTSGGSDDPLTTPPPIVDVTTSEPESESALADQPGVGPGHVEPAGLEAGAAAGPRSTGGESATGHANISTVARPAAAEEVDLREAPASHGADDVSRETSADGGEAMDPGRDDEALEDEAAIAVRDAVSRAAAEAGVDVSRETDPTAAGFPVEPAPDGTIDAESAARNARVTFRIHRDALNGIRRVLAVANQKGGVGKSTTAVNLGAYLALAGARVLVVDLDPQGNASTGLGLDHRDIEPSIYDVLTGEAATAAAIRATGVPNLHVLPSTIDLAGAEVELVSAMSRETRLRRALQSIDHQYDTILIDCPPSLGLLTVNALAAADELLIPIQCEYYALEGLGQLLRNVELVRANLNPDLRIGGIVLTMYDGRTRLALQVVEEVRKHFTDVVYQTVVPRSVRLSEAPGYGLPIALYDPLSRGGIAYRDLTYELAERSGLLAPTGEGAS
jgi:chromosome partitioning protein